MILDLLEVQLGDDALPAILLGGFETLIARLNHDHEVFDFCAHYHNQTPSAPLYLEGAPTCCLSFLFFILWASPP